jgi:hypothetical protein
MSLGTILDVAIGVILTYVLLAIVVSGVQEAIAGWLSRRGKSLRNGLQSLLAGTGTDGKADDRLFRQVFGHGLIADSAANGLPSYVPARNFALALLEKLKDGSQAPLFSQVEASVANLPPGPARDSLTAFVTHAAGDMTALQSRIETWFDDAMDRVSGVYKRRSQLYLFVIGIAVAVSLNVDSFAIIRTLSMDDNARAAMVALAQSTVEPKPGATQAEKETAAKEALKQLKTLPLPIGWTDPLAKAGQERSAWRLFLDKFRPAGGGTWRGEGVWAAVGWLLSGVAASLGAPYWFALLQQVLGLRNAGPKPATPPAKAAEAST